MSYPKPHGGPWHAPGLGEIHDQAHRCIAVCVDVDPVTEEERPVPDADEGQAIAEHIVACVNAAAEARSAVPSSHVSGMDGPSVPSDRAGGEGVRAPDGTTEQAWVHPRRAEFDKFDDGHGPYMEHEVIPLPMTDAAPPLWAEFKEWFARDFGQGYSLACEDGTILDTVTAWAFRAFRAGTRHAAVHHEAPEPNLPKASKESILREALARLMALYRTNVHAAPIDEANGRDTSEHEKAAMEAARSALAGMPPNASVDPTERSG